MGDWGNEKGTDAFGSSDPFGAKGDVFGHDFGDVDPFQPNDSFGGDFEWDEFNGEENINDGEGSDWDSADEDASEEDGEERQRERRSENKKSPSSGTSTRHKSSSSSSRRDREKRGSSRRSDSSRRSSSKSGASSSGRRKSSTTSRDRDRSERRSDRKSSSSRGKSDRTKGGRRSNSEYSSRSEGHHSRSPEKSSRQTVSDGFDTGAFDAFGDNDPFGIGTAAPASADDGFGGFADFGGTMAPGEQQENAFAAFGGPSAQQQGGFDSGFDDFAHRPPKHRSSAPAHVLEGFDRTSSHRRGAQRRASLGNSQGVDNHVPHTPMNNRFRLRTNSNGGTRRMRPSEQSKMDRDSSERRSAIKDSLFGALGEDDPNNGVSLGSFLGKTSNGSERGSRRSGASVDGSVHSAPAILRPPLRGSRQRRTSIGADSVASGGNMAGKSRRYQRKMGIPPTVRDTPTRHKEPVKLDIAALAEQGYLEVQDGKMRLVIDMDSQGGQ